MTPLRDLVAEELGLPAAEVTEDTGPATTDVWTSLRHVRLVAAVEGAYGVRLTAREARSARSVGALRRVLRTRGVAV